MSNKKKKPGMFTREAFELKAVKVLNDTLTATYLVECVDPETEGAWKDTYDVTGAASPDPALSAKLSELKRALAYQHGLLRVEGLLSDKDFKPNQVQKNIIEKKVNEILKDTRVTGFSLSGDNLELMKIKGTYKGAAINGHIFSLDGDDDSGEIIAEDCRNIVKSMETFVFDYVFNGVRSQLSALV